MSREISSTKILKTENCVICGRKARNWHGKVRFTWKNILDMDVHSTAVAGFCDNHNGVEPAEYKYAKEWMGELISMF